jgi:hypothetical protein
VETGKKPVRAGEQRLCQIVYNVVL